MAAKSLIIIGSGSSTIEIIDIVNDINKFKKEKIKILGILDDSKKVQKKKINDIRVIGFVKDIDKFKNNYFFLSILSYKNRFIRDKIIKRLSKLKIRFINIIHPNAIIGRNSKLGKGCLVYNNSNIFSNAEVGDFTTISPNASVAPKAKVEKNCFIGHGVVISSGSLVKKNSYIGYKSSVIENVKLNEGSRVMPYSMVNKTVNQKKTIMFGAPAKIIGFDNKWKKIWEKKIIKNT